MTRLSTLISDSASTPYLRGAVNIPVSDNFAMRLAGYSSHEEGFAKNVFSGNDEIDHNKKAIRWSTRYESDALSIDTVVDWEDRKQSGSMYRAIDNGDIWDALDGYIVDDTTVNGSNQQIDSDLEGGDADIGDLLTIGGICRVRPRLCNA